MYNSIRRLLENKVNNTRNYCFYRRRRELEVDTQCTNGGAYISDPILAEICGLPGAVCWCTSVALSWGCHVPELNANKNYR